MPSSSTPHRAPTDAESGEGVQAVVRVHPGGSADAWNETQLPELAEEASSESADSLLRDVGALPRPRRWLLDLEPERSGQRLGHYEIGDKIGEGGMGIVYAAEDTRLRRKVALKVLPATLMNSDDRRRRFLREARSASAVHHANVATIFDVGEIEGTVYLAMEFVHGRTLRAHLKEHGSVDVSAALDIGVQAARGLARAHAAGVIHRDVKPENIMIASDGMVKLLDFGLAKLAKTGDEDAREGADVDPKRDSDELASHVGTVLGTPAYMSPEQAAGRAVDVRTDVYSMGVVLFEMLMGARPASADPAELSFAAHVPSGVASVVRTCLCIAADERYADAEKLERALLELTAARSAAPGWRLPVAVVAAGGVAAFAAWLALRSPPELTAPASTVVLTLPVSATSIATSPSSPVETQAAVTAQASAAEPSAAKVTAEPSAKPANQAQQTPRMTASSISLGSATAPSDQRSASASSSAKQTLQGAVAKDAPF